MENIKVPRFGYNSAIGLYRMFLRSEIGVYNAIYVVAIIRDGLTFQTTGRYATKNCTFTPL